MVKMVSLLRRPEHEPLGEFHRWWLEVHAPLAKKIPGLRKYVVSLVESVMAGDSDWDGIAELWFDDEAALRAAFETPEAKVASDDTIAHTGRRIRLITREYPQIG